MMKNKYLIQIRYAESKEVEEFKLETDNLDWSMEQYQRNRPPFTWRVVEKNATK